MYFLRVICLLVTVSLIHIDRAVTAAERACGLESAEEWRDIYITCRSVLLQYTLCTEKAEAPVIFKRNGNLVDEQWRCER